MRVKEVDSTRNFDHIVGCVMEGIIELGELPRQLRNKVGDKVSEIKIEKELTDGKSKAAATKAKAKPKTKGGKKA